MADFVEAAVASSNCGTLCQRPISETTSVGRFCELMNMIIRAYPALADFPHDRYSDWQWYDLVKDTPAICLDAVPFIGPFIEVIDNFNRAKRLAYAFEAQVGTGKMFVSTPKLPDPNFLLSKILQYLRSATLAPTQNLSVGGLLRLFKLTNIRALNLE